MRLSEENLKKLKGKKNGAAAIALKIDKSERQVQRYIEKNSFPDDFEDDILSVIETFSIKNG